ncbi:hypothetical protein AHF37_09265, partial [Paragonimus kellicotti]
FSQDPNLVKIYVFEILDTLLVALDTVHSEHTVLDSFSTLVLSADNGAVLYDLLAKTIRRVVHIILLRSRDLPLGDNPIDESSAEYRKPALVRACEPKKARLDALSSSRSAVDSTTSSNSPYECRCPKGWREASLHACFWAVFGRVANPISLQCNSQSGSEWRQLCLELSLKIAHRLSSFASDRSPLGATRVLTSRTSSSQLFFQSLLDKSMVSAIVQCLEPGLGAWDGTESCWNRATSQWISSLVHSLDAYGYLLLTETVNTRMLHTILLQEGSSKFLTLLKYYVQWRITHLVVQVDSDTQRLTQEDGVNLCWRVCRNFPCCCLKIIEFAVEVSVRTCENVSSNSEGQLFPPTHCIWQLFALNLLWADIDDLSSVCKMSSLQKYLCVISRLGFVYQEAVIQHLLSHVQSLIGTNS